MNCESCGNFLKEESKFCGICGYSVEASRVEGTLDEPQNREYRFEYDKHLGNIILQEVVTDVCLRDSLMKYHQKRTILYCIEKETMETEHHVKDFVSVKCSRTIDLFLLLIGILSFLIGISHEEIYYILFAALLWWLGLRVNLVILKSNGAKISITGNDRSKCESFIQDLVRINKSIVVKS